MSGTLSKAKSESEGFGSALSKVGEIAGGFLAASAVQTGISKVTGFMSDSIAAYKESAAVAAQTESVLKSTGSAAGVTAQQVGDLATKFSELTGIDDETVQSAENMLLTFTNIGKDVFPDATKTVLDMSVALGQDTKDSAIQLGKALNDPINGVTALRRVGVSFTDDQLKQIKTMQQSGDVMGAQKLILGELNKEFGGSAEAAGAADGGISKLNVKMGNLQEEIGAKLLPVQVKWKELQLEAADLLITKVLPVLEQLYAKYMPQVQQVVGQVSDFVHEHWALISAIFEEVYENVKTRVEGLIQLVQGIVEVIGGVVQLVQDLFHGRWSQAWDDLKQIAAGAIDILIGYVKEQFGNIPQILADLLGQAINKASELGQRLVDAIINAVSSLPSRLGQVALDAANNFINNLSIAGISVGDVKGFLGFASGGTTPKAGAFLVGEQGPEIVALPGGSRIFNAGDTSRMLSGGQTGGGGVSVSINGPVTIQDPRKDTGPIGDIAFSIVSALRARGMPA